MCIFRQREFKNLMRLKGHLSEVIRNKKGDEKHGFGAITAKLNEYKQKTGTTGIAEEGSGPVPRERQL